MKWHKLTHWFWNKVWGYALDKVSDCEDGCFISLTPDEKKIEELKYTHRDCPCSQCKRQNRMPIIKWDFNLDTDVFIVTGEYTKIYVRKGYNDPNMVWWIVASDVSSDEYLILREQDLWDLKKLMVFLDSDKGLVRIHQNLQKLEDKPRP